MLQFTGSQRVGCVLATKQQQQLTWRESWKQDLLLLSTVHMPILAIRKNHRESGVLLFAHKHAHIPVRCKPVSGAVLSPLCELSLLILRMNTHAGPCNSHLHLTEEETEAPASYSCKSGKDRN